MRSNKKAAISRRARGLAVVAAIGAAIAFAAGATANATASHPAHSVSVARGAVTPADGGGDLLWY